MLHRNGGSAYVDTGRVKTKRKGGISQELLEMCAGIIDPDAVRK